MLAFIGKKSGRTRQVDGTLSVTNLVTKEISKNVSIAVVAGKKHSAKTKNVRSDRIYYVLKGRLTVKGENKNYTAKSGDTVFIKKNTQYNSSGTFKAVVVNAPPFDIRYEKTE